MIGRTDPGSSATIWLRPVAAVRHDVRLYYDVRSQRRLQYGNCVLTRPSPKKDRGLSPRVLPLHAYVFHDQITAVSVVCWTLSCNTSPAVFFVCSHLSFRPGSAFHEAPPVQTSSSADPSSSANETCLPDTPDQAVCTRRAPSAPLAIGQRATTNLIYRCFLEPNHSTLLLPCSVSAALR